MVQVPARGTGSSYQTCVDLESWDNGNHLADLLCQFTASYDAENGDSGAPIWIERKTLPTSSRGSTGAPYPAPAYFSGALRLGWEIQPDKAGWEGTICLSFDSGFCWY